MLARYVLILQWYSFIILYLPVFVFPFFPETREKRDTPSLREYLIIGILYFESLYHSAVKDHSPLTGIL